MSRLTLTFCEQDVTPAGGLSASLQQQTVYQPALRVVAAAQQFCTEVGEALIMIFVGMIAPDGIGVNSSQALLRWCHTYLAEFSASALCTTI